MPTTINTILGSDTFNTWRVTLNEVSSRFNDLGDKDDINIDGGNIDGAIIGGNSAAAGTFTNVTVSSTLDIRGADLLLDIDSISGNAINGGTMTVNMVEISNNPTNANHAARKDYVDSQVSTANDDAVAFAIALG